MLAVVRRMELDPELPAAVAGLRSAGWRVVVTSAGCDWYIRRLLAAAGVEIEVHANPGGFEAGKGLLMEMPAGSPYLSPTLGVDKAGVVRGYLDAGADGGVRRRRVPGRGAGPARVRAGCASPAATWPTCCGGSGCRSTRSTTWSDIADHSCGREA